MKYITHSPDPEEAMQYIEGIVGTDYNPAIPLAEAMMGGDPIRVISVSQLCSISDAASRLGVQANTVRRWAERRETTKFPEPIYTYNNQTAIYDFQEIERWHEVWTATRR